MNSNVSATAWRMRASTSLVERAAPRAFPSVASAGSARGAARSIFSAPTHVRGASISRPSAPEPPFPKNSKAAMLFAPVAAAGPHRGRGGAGMPCSNLQASGRAGRVADAQTQSFEKVASLRSLGTNDILRAVADRIADGCHTHEVSIGIKQNNEAAIRAAIATTEGTDFQAGLKKAAVDAAFTTLQIADVGGQATLTNCKLRLRQKLGERWSAAWEPTGFPHGSTAIPTMQDERFTLLKKLQTYFTNVPANESADMGATAAICEAAWDVLSGARQGVADAESAQTIALSNQGAAIAALRKRVRAHQ